LFKHRISKMKRINFINHNQVVTNTIGEIHKFIILTKIRLQTLLVHSKLHQENITKIEV